MDKPQNTGKTIQQIKCAGCNFEVRDSEEDEVLRVIHEHAKRKHNKDFKLEDLRHALRPVGTS